MMRVLPVLMGAVLFAAAVASWSSNLDSLESGSLGTPRRQRPQVACRGSRAGRRRLDEIHPYHSQRARYALE